MGFMGHFLDNTKKLRKFFPIVPKISDHSVINAPKITAKENGKKANALSKKLHFCENCYIWGKAIAGTAKILLFIVIYSLAHDEKMPTWDDYYYIIFQ